MRLRLVLCSLVVTLVGVLPSAPAAPARAVSPSILQSAVWGASLTGSSTYPAVRGSLRLYEDPYERYITVSLSHAGALSGDSLTVYYSGGQFVGTMRVLSDGTAHLYRDTSHGQVVPTMRYGKYGVSIRTGDLSLVASGKLHLLNPG
jgi:hypothetical protein